MFDPYEKWLGISKDQRPVDYFRLLDLDPEETDPKAIRAAAKRQSERLTRHQDGPHAKACARLLEEINHGRDILLEPSKRNAYELQLHKASRAPEEETEESDSPRPAGKGKNKGSAKPSRKTSPPPESSRTWLWAALGGGVLFLVLGGGVTAFVMTRPKKADPPAPASPVAFAPQPPAPKKEDPPKQPAPKKEEPKPTPTPTPAPKPPPVIPKPLPPPLSRPPVVKPAIKVVKLPVPSKADQDKAEKLLKETYKADYAKGKAEGNLALAVKLLQPGRENRADPAAWFVLLREAREAAVRAGRPRLAAEAITEIDKWFIIDPFSMKLRALASISEMPDGPAAVVKTAVAQVETALALDNYDAALRLLAAAEAAARKGKLDDKLPQIEARRGKVESYEKIYQKVAAAREKLRTAPDDADANLIVGKHLCLFHGLWDEGLPLLAKGGAAGQAPLARQDLTPPADVKAQVSVGDGWWTLSPGQTGRQKRHLQERALAWYDLAVPKLTGDDLVRLTKRMAEALRSEHARIPRLKPGSFLGRNDIEDRILLLREGGGTMKTEAAIENGLLWLSKHQWLGGTPGRWSTHSFHKAGRCNCSEPGQPFDVAGTAFGLLPFLGMGETHKQGRYQLIVRRGLAYLRSKQKPEGNFSDHAYENALATLAVCEAYGQTKDKNLLVPAQLAVNYIVSAQHPNGSWDYSAGKEGDTSISAWQFSALKAAHFAGLSVPATPFARVSKFLETVADPNGLGYGYRTRGAGRATSAAGLLCQEFLGLRLGNPILDKGIKQLLDPGNFVTKDKPSIYFIFYATQTMHHAGGESWEAWNPKVRDLFVELQDQGKEKGKEHQKGSWSPRGDDYAVQGGRLMFTSLALLTLETYYYHIPLNGYGPAVLLE